MIRRLDLVGAARISYRFPYILEIADLLVRKKLSNLSGSAQSHLFQLIEALLQQGTLLTTSISEVKAKLKL